MKKEFVRNPYNYDSDELSELTGLKCEDPSLTAQEFVEESDINYIANRFMRTGEIKVVPNMPTSGDFSGIFDFQSAMNLVVEAKRQFMDLPAKIRSRFSNDPAQLIAFLEDDKNRKEAEALGLVEVKETPAPPKEEPKVPPSTKDEPKGGGGS